jgi:iduronate 2-sulfatase
MKYLLLVFSLVSSSSIAAERPNVLLILVDDLKPAIEAFGDRIAITPNLDRLTRRGMRFDAAYCNQAVCAPSRFNLMLGSRSTSSGLYDLDSDLRKALPNAVTLPQYFAKHGYRTESLGKVFHIGHGNDGDPDSFSVPHFKDLVVEYQLPESTGGGQLTREEGYFTNQGKFDPKGKLRPRGAAFEAPAVEDEAYADGRIAKETINRLTAAKESDQPFFIAAGFVRPHLPFCVPKKYWDLYDPAKFRLAAINSAPEGAPQWAVKSGATGEIAAFKPVSENEDIDDDLARKLIHGYYASTSYVDTQIGKVITAIDRLGLAENTIIVLWGDHGFHLGELGIWTKHVNYEPATRIPIVIVAPGVITPGSSTGQLAETVDIYPTLADLAGLPPPAGPQPIDGTSLVPVLKNPAARVRDHAYHCFPRGGMLGRAIRTDRYRLVDWRPVGKPDATPVYELYDYQSGPVETVNLAEKKPEIVSNLRSILARHPEPYAFPPAKHKPPVSTPDAGKALEK